MQRFNLLISLVTLAVVARRWSRVVVVVLAATMIMTSLGATVGERGLNSTGQLGVAAFGAETAPTLDHHGGTRSHCHCAQAARPSMAFVPPARTTKRATFPVPVQAAASSFAPSPLPEPPRV